MIKSVRLTNFFSFRDCEITLEPDVTVLVGINGSGKTNLLRAFELLKAGMDGGLRKKMAEWGGIRDVSLRGENYTAYQRHDFGLEFNLRLPKNSQARHSFPNEDLAYKLTFIETGPNEYVVSELLDDSNFSLRYLGDGFDENERWLSERGFNISELYTGQLPPTEYNNEDFVKWIRNNSQELALSELGNLDSSEIQSAESALRSCLG